MHSHLSDLLPPTPHHPHPCLPKPPLSLLCRLLLLMLLLMLLQRRVRPKYLHIYLVLRLPEMHTLTIAAHLIHKLCQQALHLHLACLLLLPQSPAPAAH